MTPRLMRSRNDKMLAGVAGGLARSLGLDPVIVRVVLVLLFLAPHSPALLIYLILWLVMPLEPAPAEAPHRYDPSTGQPLG